MTIRQVYDQYFIPENLQQHMLRVAALGQMICGAWQGQPLPYEKVVFACLLHDLAKPISFDLTQKTQFISSDEEWIRQKEVQRKLIEKYGPDEHAALQVMCQELHVPQVTRSILEQHDWRNVPLLLKNQDLAALVPIYCDMRITPNGLASVTDRVANLIARRPIEGSSDFTTMGNHLEEFLQGFVALNLNSISSDDVELMAQNLGSLELDFTQETT